MSQRIISDIILDVLVFLGKDMDGTVIRFNFRRRQGIVVDEHAAVEQIAVAVQPAVHTPPASIAVGERIDNVEKFFIHLYRLGGIPVPGINHSGGIIDQITNRPHRQIHPVDKLDEPLEVILKKGSGCMGRKRHTGRIERQQTRIVAVGGKKRLLHEL